MKTSEFLNQLQHDDIVAAIQDAEGKTSGQNRIFISHKSVDDAVAAATKAFEKLGMTQTRERNGVLIFVAPRSHKFAVIGDEGIHRHCGNEFWPRIAEAMSGHFKKSEFTPGIIHGIHMAGKLLAEHFPRRIDGHNELPDRVEHD